MELMKAGLWSTVEPKLSAATLQVLGELNFEEMTPVQSATLPLFLKNTDVVVEVCWRFK
jgi:ATP-dependent RNA helicase DDX55/SPB4